MISRLKTFLKTNKMWLTIVSGLGLVVSVLIALLKSELVAIPAREVKSPNAFRPDPDDPSRIYVYRRDQVIPVDLKPLNLTSDKVKVVGVPKGGIVHVVPKSNNHIDRMSRFSK